MSQNWREPGFLALRHLCSVVKLIYFDCCACILFTALTTKLMPIESEHGFGKNMWDTDLIELKKKAT